MNNLQLTVFAEPFSINKAYYLKSYGSMSATKVRTKECREWGDKILFQFEKYSNDFKQFKECFNEDTDALRIELTYNIPRDYYYTKEGKISLRSCDLTNVEKLLVDILCDERFNGRYLNGNKILNLNINDKYITELFSEKKPSDKEYKIIIKIIKIPK
jgi:hypothetical protein